MHETLGRDLRFCCVKFARYKMQSNLDDQSCFNELTQIPFFLLRSHLYSLSAIYRQIYINAVTG